MTINSDSVWATVLRDKYLQNYSISNWPSTRVASHIWKWIIHTRHFIAKGTKWTIGDGSSVDLWKDWWCGPSPLGLRYPGPHADAGMKVKDITDCNGVWDVSLIDHIISHQTMEEIRSIHLPHISDTYDKPHWSEVRNFSAAVAYIFLNNEVTDQKSWNWLWKIKIPQKL